MDDVATMRKKIDEAAQYITARVDSPAKIGIILGTGLQSLDEGIDLEGTVDYEDIPHFPISTVENHTGKLLLGRLEGKPVICMQGRFHYYEGYSFQEIAFPIRVFKKLGVDTLIVSNACGGLNPNFVSGDIVLIKDHINFFPGNPLIGPNDNDLGPRYPDMYGVYDFDLIKLAKEIAIEQKVRLQEGVYVGVPGPMLETAAEYRMFRIMGADVVGMSTVPEVIAARHCGIRAMGFSIVTDMGLPDALQPLNIEEVIAIAGKAEPVLREIIAGCVQRM